MRLSLLLLLLFNLLLFIWNAGYLGARQDGHEPQRLLDQVNSEKIRLLSADSEPAAAFCRRIEGLTDDTLQTLRSLVATREGVALEVAMEAAAVEQWIAIPGIANAALAEKKQVELRSFGITDSKVIEEAELGPFVVSIANFRDAARAKQYLDDLTTKGVRSARLLAHKQTPAKGSANLRVDATHWPSAAGQLTTWLNANSTVSAKDCPTP
jgi:hypothetical protein